MDESPSETSSPTVYSESMLTTKDGTRIFVRRYTTETPASRTLVIVHGVSEHGERYDHVARIVIHRGWNVLIGDLRGHGRSEGVPTHVNRFHEYLKDLDAIWASFELDPARTALMGHSMGGLVSLRFAQMRPSRLAALVLLAPLLRHRVAIPPMTVALGRLMSLVAPATRFRSRIDPATTTRDVAALEERLNDPLIHRSVTARWYFQVRAALKSAFRDAPQLCAPVLVLQGEQDVVVDPSATTDWLELVAATDKAFWQFPNHYHNLMNEPDWQQTVDLVMEWLDERVAAA